MHATNIEEKGYLSFIVERILKGSEVPDRLDLPISRWDNSYQQEYHPSLVDVAPYSHRFLLAFHRGPTNITAIDLDATPIVAITADLVVLKSYSDVLRIAKDEARRTESMGQRPKAFDWPAPGYNLRENPFYGVRIIVPVDDQLEQYARAVISEKVSGQRPAAVTALQYFRSPANIRLLQGLLRDQDSCVQHYSAQVLRSWDVDVQETTTTKTGCINKLGKGTVSALP